MNPASRPTEQEKKINSRSRSAVWHVMKKHKGVRVVDVERAAYPLLGWGTPPEPHGGDL